MLFRRKRYWHISYFRFCDTLKEAQYYRNLYRYNFFFGIGSKIWIENLIYSKKLHKYIFWFFWSKFFFVSIQISIMYALQLNEKNNKNFSENNRGNHFIKIFKYGRKCHFYFFVISADNLLILSFQKKIREISLYKWENVEIFNKKRGNLIIARNFIYFKCHSFLPFIIFKNVRFLREKWRFSQC